MSHPRATAPRALGALTLVALALPGCRDDQRVVVPNRVLDRPLDVVLACVQYSGTQVEVLSLNQCEGSRAGDCDDSSPTPNLIGFVANSERNELAMFRRCDPQAALVDLDPQAPGYNLIPAGILPSALTITQDSCRAVSANAGSCDFTMLDVPGLAAYAIDTELSDVNDDGSQPLELPPPSSLVSTLVPRTSEGVPLASSPAEILAVPSTLSLAGSVDDTDDGAGDGSDPDDPAFEGTICSGTRPASVYVAFPACQLVAEISLGTSAILQSRQLVTTETGEVEIVDTGTTPICPVDCPAQLDGAPPEAFQPVDPNGVFPSTLALVLPPGPDAEVDDAEEEVTYAALFVGGPGSDVLFEIPIEDDGRFGDVANTLALDDPQGVQKIRVTPAFEPPADAVQGGGNRYRQFVYVISGDGSTHVVDRSFDPDDLGIECDTQIDPTLEPPTFCSPITPGQNLNAIARRPFAVGPGIRAPLGATINDWAFHKVTTGTLDEQSDEGGCNPRTPFCAPGVVGVGVTSLGTVVYSSFGQYSASDTISPGIDPVGVMQIQVRPHSLWPAIDPFASNPPPEALPLVSDEEPGRAIPGGGVDAQTLSPSLRRIDLAYSAEGEVSNEQQMIAAALGNPSNVDELGSREGEGLYENPVVRAAVRDFQQWGSQTWTLEWEPTVPGTTSSTGLLECDDHGSVDSSGNQIPGGTCRNVEPDGSRLRDESANFCEDGVLAGDKLAVLGCTDDDTCGLGQRCLRDPTAPTTASGICVSSQAYDDTVERDALREACSPFIRDACGSAQREYRITRATNDELWLQPLERPVRSVVRDMAGPDEELDLREYAAKLTCDSPVRRVEAESCRDDADCLADPYDPENQRGAFSCDKSGLPLGDEDPGDGRCVGQQPDGGCDDDQDCLGLGAQYLCVDSTCRAPCDLCAPPAQPEQPCRVDDECLAEGEVCIAGMCHEPCTDGNPGCLQSPLPGPRCFPELTRYTVRLHQSFSFAGSSTSFLTDRVIVDPTTGECVEDPEVSTLLTSRIRLGADAPSTFGTGPWQIADCTNPNEAQPGDPNPCRIVTERLTDPGSLFHSFRYVRNVDQPVDAIRFSTPVMSVAIDLVSLLGIASDPPEYVGETWPAQFATFLRARIPNGYREEFSTTNGFIPYNEPVVVGARTPMVYPVRIIHAPESNADFIVDAGGRGGVVGIRGQVIRINHGTGQVLADDTFLVR